MSRAYERWNDADPRVVLEAAEAALAAGPRDRLLRAQVLLLLASVHQVKTADTEQALRRLEELEALLEGDESEAGRRMLADALVRRASLLYAERDDPRGALACFRRAQVARFQASTSDSVSQLLFRLGRDPARPAAERREHLELALALSREAVHEAPRGQEARPRAARARYRLQLVLVLEALGRKGEAADAWALLRRDDLDDNALYLRGVLHALRGEPDPAREAFEKALALRATPAARNALRRYLRGEPDARPLLARPDWAKLAQDE